MSEPIKKHGVISGFASFAQKGKPIGSEPVQIYEDSPFWNKVKEMAGMEDRIKQMAIEAGFGIGHSEAAATLFDKFAKLIAEDCAKVADGSDYGPVQHNIGDKIRARYDIT